jgi:catechol 2,3-dioxygenase-like lactoylglutathione lyase family enzyme
MRAQPMIAVKDVPASSDWYQSLLGGYSDMDPDHPHRQEFDRVLCDGIIVLLLHSWGAERVNAIDRLLVDPNKAPIGHGVLLGFRCEDFESALQRVQDLKAEVVEDVDENPDHSRSIFIRDPDGYIVKLDGPTGDGP